MCIMSDGKCYGEKESRRKAGKARGERGSGQGKPELRRAEGRTSREMSGAQVVWRGKSKCEAPP